MRTSQITICKGCTDPGARLYPKSLGTFGDLLRKNNPVLSELQRGFTLLELLVVLFLASLLMAIVFPSLYGTEGMRLKSESKRIASVLRYLNDSSIATKDPYSLTFDFGENTISWNGPDVDKTEQFKSLSSVELPSKGNVREGQVIVPFGPLGIQESLVVHLRQPGEAMTIALNQLSGRVAIKTDDQ